MDSKEDNAHYKLLSCFNHKRCVGLNIKIKAFVRIVEFVKAEYFD